MHLRQFFRDVAHDPYFEISDGEEVGALSVISRPRRRHLLRNDRSRNGARTSMMGSVSDCRS
jgi:hypothetical protein